MASFDGEPSFDRGTPVLRFRYSRVPNARWVLWPVVAWRVVAPVPRERKLNLFQRAVLGLARARVTRVADVASRLLIAPDLVELVVLELLGFGYLDHTGKPTTKGLRVLEDLEEDPADEARVGHVLADAFSAKLFPRFLKGDLPLADVELDDAGRPVLLSGSAGDPWRDRAFGIFPGRGDTMLDRPGAADVLRVARRHRRKWHLDGRPDEQEGPRLQRVSFVDEHPQPYLLALQARQAEGDWTVDDPFGGGEAFELRARLEGRMDSTPALRKWLAPLVGADPEAPNLEHLGAQAQWMVEERLTLAIRQHETLFDYLVAMQRTLLEAESPAAPADKLGDVVVKAQRAVERVLRTVHDRYRSKVRLFDTLSSSDQRFNRELINQIAEDCGFHIPLPKSLSEVRRGKVQHAEESGEASLRPLLVLALLYANRHDEHPLRRAASSEPDLLQRLNELATARDGAAHDGARERASQVQRHVETTYAAVQALLF